VRVLLDTHTLIWAVDDPGRLPPAAVVTLQNPANQLMVSAATVWEVAIKTAIGKLSLSAPYRQWMTKALTDLGAAIVPVDVEYADRQAGLPFHHRDPFDRLLVAQALVESVPLVSGDAQFDLYGVMRIW